MALKVKSQGKLSPEFNKLLGFTVTHIHTKYTLIFNQFLFQLFLLTNRQTDRQTDKQTDRQTDT